MRLVFKLKLEALSWNGEITLANLSTEFSYQIGEIPVYVICLQPIILHTPDNVLSKYPAYLQIEQKTEGPRQIFDLGL